MTEILTRDADKLHRALAKAGDEVRGRQTGAASGPDGPILRTRVMGYESIKETRSIHSCSSKSIMSSFDSMAR
jgi:hypothetical protein